MPKIVGQYDSLLLISENAEAVVVDADFGIIVETGKLRSLLSARNWSDASTEIPEELTSLIASALETPSESALTAAGSRLYTIPKAAQAEAKKALAWRKDNKRGGTPVGMNTARTLAEGGQIGIEKVRHIAKYFPRHEVDKKGKGWKVGEPQFPSNGRIAWALWGGDAAWRWAADIVERENNRQKALKADSYVTPETLFVNPLDDFKRGISEGIATAPEFLARVRMDGSGIDRLYKVDVTGMVYVWDDGCWENLGSFDGDVWTYDKALDDPYDTVEKSHIQIDPESAIIIAARLEQDPYTNVSVFDIDADEAALMQDSFADIDYDLLDTVITAAAPADAVTLKSTKKSDGQYTEEERSAKATAQARDAFGKFIPSNGRVTVGGDPSTAGKVTGTNEDGTVSVKFDNGRETNVDPKLLHNADAKADAGDEDLGHAGVQVSNLDTPLDVSGILGQPRTPIDQVAQLPGTLPRMTAEDLHDVLYNWDSWVQEQRDAFIELPDSDVIKYGQKKYGGNPKKPLTITSAGEFAAEEHPLLKKLNAKKKSGVKTALRDQWAQPIVAAVEEEERVLTPETSDVKPLYMAIVAEDDPRAVLQLVSLVPATNKSTAPMTYKRVDQKWVKAESILTDMKSATPPPVVPLDEDVLQEVLKQVDGITASAYLDHAFMVLWGPHPEVMAAVVAAGGMDRNSGNAEDLRRYWTRGKGAAKIRWGTAGDWTRCVRNLSKYMGPRAKGYCSLRHKEVTGMWTGDKRHRQIFGRKRGSMRASFSNEMLNASNHVIDLASRNARMADAKARVAGITAGAYEVSGAKFSIPLVIPEGLESGDGRKFRKGSITMREFPLPLLWQIKTADGHMGSVVVGRIDHMERTDEGIGNAYGVFDAGSYGQEAERLVRNGFIRGISADMDQFEAEEEKAEASEDSKDVKKDKLVINKARVMAATIVPKPAFQECQIFLVDDQEKTPSQEETVIPDGVYAEDVDPADAAAIVACGYVAGSIPLVPPTEWFDNPQLKKATPLTITDEGKVFGHIAAWHVDHIGLSFGTKPPRSKSQYSYFHTGVIRTEDGSDVPVGQLTLAGGHASLEASAAQAAKHYDDTGSAFADVHAGEDSYGIWVSGSLRPGISPEQIRAARASAPSGDWRPIRGSLELVAVCQVNVPGFPIARARVASGAVMALVAAGAQTLAKMKSDPIHDLNARLARLEEFTTAELNSKADSAKALFAEVKAQRNAELSARALELSSKMDSMFSYDDEFAFISRRERKDLAEKGQALEDGSFPIRNAEDLKNAVSAYGRAKEGKRASVQRFIMKRARQLKRPDLVPTEWKEAANAEFNAKIEAMRSKTLELSAIVAAPAELEPVLDENGEPMLDENGNPIMGNPTPQPTPTPSVEDDSLGKADAVEPVTPEQITDDPSMIDVVDESTPSDGKVVDGKFVPGKTQPRDEEGRFRKVLARLKQDLGDAGLQKIVEEAKTVEGLHEIGNYTEASKAAEDLLSTVDRLDSGALNKISLENVRSSAAELGKVIANLPLGFSNQAEKLRYSDLPPALQNLMEEMIDRVEVKIGKEDAAIATEALKGFKSGSDVYSQAEISSQMSKLLRLLT